MRPPRRSSENARRRHLIEAAYLTFIDHGLQGMTMARIGERAGMSHGIVNYYFRSKDELLSVVIRKTIFKIRAEVVRRLKAARTPRERVSAIIGGHFEQTLFTPDVARAWISYYAHIGSNGEFARAQSAADRRLHSNLVHAFRQLTDEHSARDAACMVEFMIDGAWLRQTHPNRKSSPEDIIRCIEAAVDNRLKADAQRNCREIQPA